jgi:hypothetical protein
MTQGGNDLLNPPLVKKRLKLKLGSAKVDGVRVYRVANGQPGQSGPRQI